MSDFQMITRISSWAESPTTGCILVVELLCAIVAFNAARGYHIETLRNFFKNSARAVYADSDNTLRSTVTLAICAIVNYALFIAIVAGNRLQLPFSQNSLWLWLIAAAIVVAWFALQWLTLLIAGYCSNQNAATQQFAHALNIIFIACGLLLFCIVVALVYAPPSLYTLFIYIGYSILTIGAFLLIAKAIQLFFRGIDTACYLFLYLCALEILPILLLRKLVETAINLM